MSDVPIQVQVLVSGRVQRVSFRAYCTEAAQAANVHGWVRNLPDGRVQAVFQGTRHAVDKMVQWCRHGSPHAKVTGVEVEVQAIAAFEGFESRL